MPSYFLDSSAIVKRYMAEAGTLWVHRLCVLRSNTITIAEITLAEVASVFARAVDARRITDTQRADYLDSFLDHCDRNYQLVPAGRHEIDQAVIMTQRYHVRGYDAVQLACAIQTNALRRQRALTALTLVTADFDLISAAIAEGLATENPNDH